MTWLPFVLAGSALLSLTFLAGLSLRPQRGLLPAGVSQEWQIALDQQRSELTAARARAEQDARALARRIAQIQAHVIRLDAAGARLTQMADIDPAEFDFGRPPALGGPESEVADATPVLADVIDSLDRLQTQLSDRERQMRVLEDLLLASRLQQEVRPSGWPIDGGYITSGFGVRTDPFTGLRTRHPGIDFASAAGTDVVAVASGIVTEARSATGYGKLVEINHGNGYRTRYGHNARLLVKVGDRVTRGQAIALMGSTGRSTGPHVHFELLLNGLAVNPAHYLDAAR